MVELVFRRQLVALALQQLHDRDPLSDEYREKPLEHIEIGLLTKQTLDGPIETDILVLHLVHKLLFLFCFHSQLILIRYPLSDTLPKIILNSERNNSKNFLSAKD